MHKEIMYEVPSNIQAAESSCFKSAMLGETLTASEASRTLCSNHHGISNADKLEKRCNANPKHACLKLTFTHCQTQLLPLLVTVIQSSVIWL